MRLIFVLLVFLPALIHGRPKDCVKCSAKDCVDGIAKGTMNVCACVEGTTDVCAKWSDCNVCWCKSKHTGNEIGWNSDDCD